MNQNKRYGFNGTSFRSHLDVFVLRGVSGKLVEAAATFGIVPEVLHRALADVRTTANLMEAVAKSKDLSVLESPIGQMRTSGGCRAEQEAIIAEAFEKNRCLPDLREIADRYGIKVGTVEGDVLRLIKNDRLPSHLLANHAVQTWLASTLEPAIRNERHGEQHGKLKPLMDRLRNEAPSGFDYTQLRLALIKLNKAN